ncbi:MAG: hypothetical protein WBE56_09330 [Terracidiphilus sp.]
MNRKLIAACLFCAWPFGLAAQSDLGNTQASTPGLYLDVDGISEFRAANPSVDDQAVPDAPTPAKKSTLHGAVEGFTGLMLVNTPYAGLRDDLPVMDLGGSAGGELGRGRTSYFVSFDQFGLNQQKLDGFLMSLQGREGGGVMPIDLNPVSFSQLSASADKKFGQRDLFYVRFNRDDFQSYKLVSSQDGKGQVLGTDLHLTQQIVAAGNTVTISPATIDETKAQLITNQVQLPAGATALGIISFVPTVRQSRILEAANNVNRQIGSGSLRMGGDFLYSQMNISFLESGLGHGSGNSSFDQASRSANLYVQTEKKVRPNLSLLGGISYDAQMLKGFKTDTNNAAPEFGVAWAPRQGTVIRGGGGISYDQLPLPAIAGPADATGMGNIQNSGRFVSRDGRSAEQLGGFTTESPTMQDAYAEHADVALEQQIGAKAVLSAESQYVHGVQLALPAASRSVSLCATSRDCEAGNAFGGQEIGTGLVSNYSGDSLTFAQQPTHWSSYKVAYTYGMAHGFGTGENNANVEDTMRRASFTGVLHTSPQAGTDFWQHLTNGIALAAGGDFTNRSEFAGMSFFNLDGRLTKTLAWGKSYHLDALAETFRTVQRTSATVAQTAAEMGSSFASFFSTCERVAAAQAPNGGQAGLRLTF